MGDEVKVTELKNKRRGCIGNITRCINKMNKLMENDINVHQVKAKIFDFCRYIEFYKKIHEELILVCEDEDLGARHVKELERVEEFQITVNNWFKRLKTDEEEEEDEEEEDKEGGERTKASVEVLTNKSEAGSSTSITNDRTVDLLEKQMEMIKILTDQQMQLTLPHQIIKPFSGDPFEYVSFMNSFENIIEAKVNDERRRLYYLEQYTEGEVKNLIKSYMYKNVKGAYKEAKEKIKNMYGSNHKIVAAFLKKIQAWPEIKTYDANALHNFALFLTECQNSIQDTNELEHPLNMKVILEKLPFDLKKAWRRKAFRVCEKDGKVKFSHLVDFVQEIADEMNHPLFGDLLDSKDKKIEKSARNYKEKDYKQNKTSTFATNTYVASCSLCKSSHYLNECEKFKQMKVEERKKSLIKMSLCFLCLKPKHSARFCKSNLSCKVCHKSHHTLLHQEYPDERSVNREYKAKEGHSTIQIQNGYVEAQDVNSRSNGIYMGIIPVKIKSASGRMIKTYAFLDNGSSHSFVTNKLMQQLKVNGRPCKLSLSTIEKRNTQYQCNAIKGLKISSLYGNNFISLPEVFTKVDFPVSSKDSAKQVDVNKYAYLRKVKIPHLNAEVGLLIGNNSPDVIEPQEFIKSKDYGPYAIRTRIGWAVFGPNKKKMLSNPRVCSTISNEILSKQMESWLKLEGQFMVKDSNPYSQEDKKFQKNFDETIMMKDDHYHIKLPLKDREFQFPNNRYMAIRRLDWLKRKFIKDKEMHMQYVEFVKDMIKKGYAEKVSKDELYAKQKWYIPHHHVYHHLKPGKIRVVFDCSASYDNVSLNSKLLQGPDTMNSLFGVLLRFRQENIAIMGDVEAMFHQVRVPVEDRNLLRFLWWKNDNYENELEEFRMCVYLFGSICSPSTAMMTLKKTADDNSAEFGENAASTIKKNFYVDDCLKSVKEEAEAIKLIKDITAALGKGGFKITKWISNSKIVIDKVPKEDRSKEIQQLDLKNENLPSERALGIEWRPQIDTFGFKTINKIRPLTRRGLLSAISSIFDPLGFLSPFILPAKMILQELTRAKYGWDDELPIKYKERWMKWTEELPMLKEFNLPRSFKKMKMKNIKWIELHLFSDASSYSYGTVAYLRMIDEDEENAICSLVCSKGRVAPLNEMTIPRLELCAATLSVQLYAQIKKEIEYKIDNVYFWTDSTAVLKYIKNESKRFHTFVANRVSRIREESNINQWFYIKSKDNPADELSRGQDLRSFLNNKRWVNGPEFMYKSNMQIMAVEDSFDLEDDDPEVKKNAIVICTNLKEITLVEEVINHYSSWIKLKKVMAFILRFKKAILFKLQVSTSKVKDDKQLCTNVPALSMKEINEAENFIIKYVQHIYYSKEMQDIEKDRLKVKNSLSQFDPIIQNGLLRIGGRLRHANLNHDAKHQIILPNGKVSDLIIQNAHEILGHMGREAVLSKIREKYWIIKGNSAVRKVISKCQKCKILYAKPLQQKMSDLPPSRVKGNDPPFTQVGLDCFGPFYIKQQRKEIKRYGLIFTCMQVRAVHLEVLTTLEADSFISALRRFIARRGQVKEIISDNGTNFIGAEKEIREGIQRWNKSVLDDYLFQKEIKWTFNPPSGSHFGGVWERCIKSVRRIFTALLNNQVLNEECLHTLLCEVEFILNCRPLTTVSDDPRDLEPLTPNHLLLMKNSSCQPDIFGAQDGYCRKRWRQVQYLADCFWKRWYKEYIQLLQIRQKWKKEFPNLQADDVVLIVDDMKARNHWPLGRVLETYPDNKGLVRKVKIKTTTGEYIRPISKLCLISKFGD